MVKPFAGVGQTITLLQPTCSDGIKWHSTEKVYPNHHVPNDRVPVVIDRSPCHLFRSSITFNIVRLGPVRPFNGIAGA